MTCKKHKIPVPSKRLRSIAQSITQYLPTCVPYGFKSRDDKFFLRVKDGQMGCRKNSISTISFPVNKLLASLTLSTESLFRFLKATNKKVACYTMDEKFFIRKLVRQSDIYINTIPCKKIRELCA